MTVTGEVTITRPGEPTRRYRLRDRSDGLTSIQRLRPDGTVEREFLYDPEGELADEASGPANGDTPATTTGPPAAPAPVPPAPSLADGC